tara:strand:+ start:208 stop:459 length:252 start_codon:yes stop_codon:yes gene_type:complete
MLSIPTWDDVSDVPGTSLFDIIMHNVEFYFLDAHDIGSSDVSICVNSVIDEYAPLTENFVSVPTRREIRRAVLEAIHEINDDW